MSVGIFIGLLVNERGWHSVVLGRLNTTDETGAERGQQGMEELALAAELVSVGLARTFVRDALAPREVDPWIVELLTSELATNVVRHAETQFTVVIAFDEHVRVEIHDGMAATAAFRELVRAPPEFAEDSPGGRGLPLVRRLSSRFGLHDEPGVHNGKVVWFEIEWTELELTGSD